MGFSRELGANHDSAIAEEGVGVRSETTIPR